MALSNTGIALMRLAFIKENTKKILEMESDGVGTVANCRHMFYYTSVIFVQEYFPQILLEIRRIFLMSIKEY